VLKKKQNTILQKNRARNHNQQKMNIELIIKLFITIGFLGIFRLIFKLYNSLVRKPNKMRSILKKQGIKGPPQSFLLGNILEIKRSRDSVKKSLSPLTETPVHNVGALLLPFFDPWRQKYGEKFMFALGNTQILLVTQPDIVREITTCTSLDLGKPSYQARERGSLLGRGILTSNGPYWAHQRKIIAPELYMDKVKGMYNMIIESTVTLINSWKSIIDKNGGIADVKIDSYMRSFSGDVISRACFGSSFSKGEDIFLRLRALQEASSKKILATGIPGMRHLPTKGNREQWALEKEIKKLILQIVKERNEVGYEKDLLQMILEGAKNSNLNEDAIDHFIVDNCKNIYLAGYETTAVSATWCLMLLAANPEWQDRVRTEAIEICQGQFPDVDMVRKMKQLTMVINESLRIYPPVVVVSREALKDMKFGEINVPKGVNLWTLVTALHTDPEVWGPDSYKFNPDRFANGIIGACKFPHLYMPFGVGPRVCLGQNLAAVELKILVSLILTNFSITLSPSYVHSPSLNLVVEPGQGVNLLIKKL
jgi:cytochrome P450